MALGAARWQNSAMHACLAAALFGLLWTTVAAGRQQAPAADRWAPVRFLIGTWEGTSEGQPGSGTVRREYRFVLRERFIEARNTVTYPPQEKNAKGEAHEDVGYFSYDRARKRLVLRQFHVEGFVNQYAAEEGGAAGRLVFTSESIENIPAGFRARETYILHGPDRFEEIFEIAEPGQPFAVYSRATLTRVRGAT
jgi:hypothetical protein